MITHKLAEAAEVQVEILRLRDQPPGLEIVRTVADWMPRGAGQITVPWDGRADGGALAAPGTYGIRVRSRRDPGAMFGAGVGWVTVV
jgi:flagellar hook assembly protein FlgD